MNGEVSSVYDDTDKFSNITCITRYSYFCSCNASHDSTNYHTLANSSSCDAAALSQPSRKEQDPNQQGTKILEGRENVLKVVGVGLMNFLRILTVLWLVVQFTLTLIYVLPTTPIQSTLEPFLDATIGKYFYQGWDFFAPDPIDTDYALLVRPLTNKEVKIALQKKGLPNDGWYDLSSPVWTKLQSNHFAAYVRFADGITNPTSSYDGDDNSDKGSLKLLIKFASAFCKDIGKSNANYVALVIRERQSVSWPDGEAPKPPVIKTRLLGTYQIDRSVENSYLYQL